MYLAMLLRTMYTFVAASVERHRRLVTAARHSGARILVKAAIE